MKLEIKKRVERIRNGEVPEGYKETKVGIIPDDWDVKKIGALTSSASGTTPSREKQKIYYTDGTHLWVKTTDLNNNFIKDTSEKVTQRALDETACKLLPKNTILVAMYGGFNQIGRTGLLKKEAACNQALTGIYSNDNFDSQYLQEVLNLRTFYWKKFAASSRKDPNITRNDVMQFPVPHSNKTEEKKIADILSTWDKAIELKEKLIEEKKEFKRGLMQNLLTGEIRFPEFTDEWDEKKIGVICEIKKGVQINKTELSFKGKYAVLNGGVSPSGYTTEWNTKENTITISEGGNSCGFVNFNKDKIWCGGHCYALTNVKMNNLLLYHILKSVEKKIMKLRVGSGLPNIQKQDVINFRLLIPKNVTEQEKIAQILDLISIEIVILIKELNQLKEQKRGLMQLLLTGIVRVEVD